MMKLRNTIFIFDVDSTLVESETLEEVIDIAIGESDDKKGVMKKIKEITNLGMEGKLDFKKSLEKRFKVVQILQEHIDLYNNKILPKHIDFRFKEIIKIIKERGGKVFIVSGGFKENIDIVAEQLNVDKKDCFANEFIKKNDKIVGFNKDNPLSESNGKVKIVQEIKKANKNKRVICVGDGNSDYLIKKEGAADEFWGFWGNVRRENIEKKADKNFYSSEELLEFVKNGF